MEHYSVKYSSIDELKVIAKIIRLYKGRNLRNQRLNFGFGYPECNHWYYSNHLTFFLMDGKPIVSASTSPIGKVIEVGELSNSIMKLINNRKI